ncbi:hypothetical protein ACL6C3_23295 [Capilliphycus salinus ALCB114379]|uniref:hypothetical protein n=1 Tax=Capilliphycus salinus TaxID=2768948 RepID=UPI0039A73499
MANSSSILPDNESIPATGLLEEDSQIWHSLKQAIASSSGFQNWQLEHLSTKQHPQMNLDRQVRTYLRETLETLAY